MTKYRLDQEKYAALARQTAAEGCVLLKNDRNALPIMNGEKTAIFGRNAFGYYKSGLGSGGLVNTRYTISILDALKKRSELSINETLLGIYEKWLQYNSADEGEGWGRVPWSQKEMPVSEEMVQLAKEAEAALIFIGRTAGEDQDNNDGEGSWQLTQTEEELIRKVTAACERTAVILNVGNIIDMSWVEKYHPQAVLYVWQGGQEGGNGAADVITGKVNPCGKLMDTIAKHIADYPSTADFGDLERNFYREDIYVGYRYFETFHPEKVLYPFGFGLSYTSFDIKSELVNNTDSSITIKSTVYNTGTYPGKEVIQVYAEVPQGKLGKPSRQLVGFKKTDVLETGESVEVQVEIPKYYMASYDDSGITGHKSCYVLEAGIYRIFAGTDVRSAVKAGEFSEEFTVLSELTEVMAPTEAFDRIRPMQTAEGSCKITNEPVPLRTSAAAGQIAPEDNENKFSGNKGYQLVDVLDEKISMNQFIEQIPDEELMAMFRGEGMCSPRVTPGTAAAFGGVTDYLTELGIPAACCTDGPSGIRMDCGTKAFSLPNGTLLGCTFNVDLVRQLFEMLGLELRLNRIDSLLGPGMNIHRNPLNGRNFEYISEDPILTGKIAAAQIEGMDKYGIGSTVKHFCANNQESGRRSADSVISERALREIYLKGFEIAAKEAPLRAVMTSYGAVNGIWTAGSYDLCTKILRNEWKFDGIVMTDWWAKSNYSGGQPAAGIRTPMILAQNDLFMCSQNASDQSQDDVMEQYHAGVISRSILVRNTRNILRYILKSPAMLHQAGRITKEEMNEIRKLSEDEENPGEITYHFAIGDSQEIVFDSSMLSPRAGSTDVFGIKIQKFGLYSCTLYLSSELGELAQLPVSIFLDNVLKTTVSIQGTGGEEICEKRELGIIYGNSHYIKMYYGANGLHISKIVIHLEKEMSAKEIFGWEME